MIGAFLVLSRVLYCDMYCDMRDKTAKTARSAVGVSSQLLKKGQEAMVAYERAGDQAVLVASSRKTREKLGWTPRKPELESIISDAWYWMGFIPASIAPK